jgi:hypothetical protein
MRGRKEGRKEAGRKDTNEGTKEEGRKKKRGRRKGEGKKKGGRKEGRDDGTYLRLDKRHDNFQAGLVCGEHMPFTVLVQSRGLKSKGQGAAG